MRAAEEGAVGSDECSSTDCDQACIKKGSIEVDEDTFANSRRMSSWSSIAARACT